MNVDKESFASLMGLKEQLKVKQEEEESLPKRNKSVKKLRLKLTSSKMQ